MKREAWFGLLANALHISVEEVKKYEQKFPVTINNNQVGFLLPVGGIGEFQAVTYEELDFTQFDFRAEVTK